MTVDFGFFLTEQFVWGYCAFIVALLFGISGKLVYEAIPLYRSLREVRGELTGLRGEGGFVGSFEEYNRHAEEAFGLAWKEFVETLVLPEPDSREPIRNTGEVSRYLNDATIIFPKVPFGFYHSVPNLLTGLGILGTFLGLAAGVGSASSGLSSGTPSEITASLQELLAGASLAFMTSIAGILCSILFVPVERVTSRRLHMAVDEWVGAIESRVERVTPAGVALLQLSEARRAATQLERFNTELIFSLEQALEEKIAGRLSPHLERLVETVEGLRQDRSTDAGQMIEQALGRFADAMQERTGSQFDEMASIVAELNRTLKNSAESLTQSQQDVRAALDSAMTTVMKSMDAGAASMTETLQQSLGDVTRVLADASGSLAEQLSASSTAAATEIRETMGSVTREMADTGVAAVSKISGSLSGLENAAENLDRSTLQSERTLAEMTNFVDQINTLRGTIEAAQRQITEAAEPVSRAAVDIRAASDKTADVLARTSDMVDRVDSLVNTLEQHQQSVAEAWSQYQNRFEAIDQSLARVFQQIDDGLSGYCDQVKQFANELDKTTSGTVQQLASATSELSGTIEDLIEHLWVTEQRGKRGR